MKKEQEDWMKKLERKIEDWMNEKKEGETRVKVFFFT